MISPVSMRLLNRPALAVSESNDLLKAEFFKDTPLHYNSWLDEVWVEYPGVKVSAANVEGHYGILFYREFDTVGVEGCIHSAQMDEFQHVFATLMDKCFGANMHVVSSHEIRRGVRAAEIIQHSLCGLFVPYGEPSYKVYLAFAELCDLASETNEYFEFGGQMIWQINI